MEIETLLDSTAEGLAELVTITNQFNELLYDEIIPRLFQLLYELNSEQKTVEHEVELVKIPEKGYYEVTAAKDKIVRKADLTADEASKSFHLDTYCFDSNPERTLFWDLIREQRIKKIYFTGMLTHGQSDFFIQYVDPDTHAVRSYYPDFLVEKQDGTYLIVEVKGDNKIEDPVVRAKGEYALQMATANKMEYRVIRGSDAEKRQYSQLLSP